MKSNTTTKSATSMSMKSVRIAEKDENKVLDFEEYVENACKKFDIPAQVIVKKEYQDDSFLRSLRNESKISRKSMKSCPMLGKRTTFTLLENRDEDMDEDRDENRDENRDNTVRISAEKENVLIITPIYDSQNNLVEILLNEAKTVPRLIVKILGFIIPQFPFLIRIAIKKCKIDKYTIYEMCNFLEFTSVTDVCLDGSTCREANFALLLQNTRISSLSLCRCGINDVVCETIASHLHYTQPVQCCLTTLNLSSNRITDVGAKCLGLTLRSNRYLRYLNLADNCITDEGASHILKPLMNFPLTLEEFNAERVLYDEYLKDKFVKTKIGFKPNDDSSILVAKKLKSKLKKKKLDKTSSGVTKDKKRISCSTRINEKPSSSDINVTRVTSENLSFNEIDYFGNPFSNSNVKRIDGIKHCTGNLVLCYLNLAYNDISYITVKKLNEVLKYQSEAKSSSNYGLIKVVIEGNSLPSAVGCTEMKILNELLKKALLYTAKLKK